MPIDLNAFRTAVEHVHNDSFVRMSDQRPGEIVNFGTNLLGRKLGWYHHGTAVQNQDVREQLFRALQGEGEKVQAGTLEQIRLQLGINAQGKSSLTSQLTAREVRMILSAVTSGSENVKARQKLASELGREYNHPDLKDLIARRLCLADSAVAVMPLTDVDKMALQNELKHAGITLFDTMKKQLRLPDMVTLQALITDDKKIAKIREQLNAASFAGKFSRQELIILKGEINEAIVMARKAQAEAKLQQALDSLKAETGVDCSAGKKAMLDDVIERTQKTCRGMAQVIQDNSVIDKAFDEVVAKIVQTRKVMIEGILQADPKLDPTVEKGLLEIAVSDLNFNQPAVALVLPKYISMAGELFEYSRDPKPTMTGFLDKMTIWEDMFDRAATECRAVFKGDFGGNDLQHVSDWLVRLARIGYRAKYGENVKMGEPMKHLLERLCAELKYFQENPEAGADLSKPYAYSDNYARFQGGLHFFTFAEACVHAFESDANLNPKSADSLSDEVGDFMVRSGSVVRRHSNPFGNVIDDHLGTLFQDTLLKDYLTAIFRSTKSSLVNYADIFRPTIRDLGRKGYSLTLGDKTIALADEGILKESGLNDIKAFFEQDTKGGINAARVLGDFLSQALPLSCIKAMGASGEGCGGIISSLGAYAVKLNVTRDGDGHYLIDFKYDLIPSMYMETPTSVPVDLDQTRSRISFDFTLELSIDENDKAARIDFQRGAHVHTELHKTQFTPAEVITINCLRDGDTGKTIVKQMLSCPELASDAHLKQMLGAERRDDQAIFDYVKDKIITGTDMNVLFALGLNEHQIDYLILGLHPEARLTKALMKRLTGPDAAERQAAYDELRGLCRKLAEAGWQKMTEFNDIDDMALVTVGGLKVDEGKVENSELFIVHDYIKSSPVDAVRAIPRGLSSGDAQQVAAAKAQLAAIVPEARRAMGVDLLRTLDGAFSPDDIEMLRTAPDQPRVAGYLENIVLKNDEMEPSIQVLKTYIEALKIMNS